MKTENCAKTFLVILAFCAVCTAFATRALATDDDCRSGHEQCGHNGDGDESSEATSEATGTGTAEATAGADSESDAAASSNATGGAGGQGGSAASTSSGGGASVSTQNKSDSRSVYLGAARDTAACFTKVQIGAEGFGIGWSRSDAFCKKVRLIARKVDEGNLAAAARLECTLPEWQEVYGHKGVRDKSGSMTAGYSQCLDDLTPPEEDGYINFNEPQPSEVAASLELVGVDHKEDITMVRLEQQQLRSELDGLREEQQVQATRQMQAPAQAPPPQPFLTDEKRNAVLDALYGEKNE